ncbi:TfoX/Sxy family protein [Gracilimonas sp. BCB1]|uniref:TfoX/Sxy family protein n=1 Tax=Gracilimonas sp. BCB1 TaxID=3152362 RepID=UPI0032D95B70
MAFDEGLAERVRNLLQNRDNVVEKKMFGGLCFMVSGHMTIGIVNDKLMARIGPDQYEECLTKPHAIKMDFTGRPMKGMIYVLPEGLQEDQDLKTWLDTCLSFTSSLTPK